MPPDWGYFHDAHIVENGFRIWAARGFGQKPTLEEAAAREDTFASDLNLRLMLHKRMSD